MTVVCNLLVSVVRAWLLTGNYKEHSLVDEIDTSVSSRGMSGTCAIGNGVMHGH